MIESRNKEVVEKEKSCEIGESKADALSASLYSDQIKPARPQGCCLSCLRNFFRLAVLGNGITRVCVAEIYIFPDLKQTFTALRDEPYGRGRCERCG